MGRKRRRGKRKKREEEGKERFDVYKESAFQGGQRNKPGPVVLHVSTQSANHKC